MNKRHTDAVCAGIGRGIASLWQISRPRRKTEGSDRFQSLGDLVPLHPFPMRLENTQGKAKAEGRDLKSIPVSE
jgi:hypothetical protein